MKVKFITCAADSAGVIMPGTVIDVSDMEAKLLVDGKYAQYAEEIPAPQPVEDAEKSPEKTVKKKKK